MNITQPEKIYHALLESQHPMHPNVLFPEALGKTCYSLIHIHNLCLKIAKSKNDPFKLGLRSGACQVEQRISQLGEDVIGLLSQLSIRELSHFFPVHTFNPVISLFLETMRKENLIGQPVGYLNQYGQTINQCFNNIRIASYTPEFKQQCEQWLNAVNTQKQAFRALMNDQLKQQTSYHIARFEFAYQPQCTIYTETVEQHGEFLMRSLLEKEFEDSILAMVRKLDFSHLNGYRHSMLLLLKNPIMVNINRVMDYWQQNIARQHGHCLVHGFNTLSYRAAGTGLIQLGDIYRKPELDQARIYMTEIDYLIRTNAKKPFEIFIPGETDPLVLYSRSAL